MVRGQLNMCVVTPYLQTSWEEQTRKFPPTKYVSYLYIMYHCSRFCLLISLSVECYQQMLGNTILFDENTHSIFLCKYMCIHTLVLYPLL